MNELIMDALIVGAVAGAIAGEGRHEAAPVLDFIKQDINQGNGATGWVDRAKVAGFSDKEISEAF